MKDPGGKVRIGVIAILSVTAFAMLGVYRPSRPAYSVESAPFLFVTDGCSSAVTAYPAGSNGDVSPLSPVPTGLSEPFALAFDTGGKIYATNQCNGTVTIYGNTSSGDAAPIATIGGSNTGLMEPTGIALDSSNNIYVTDERAKSVFVYPALGISTGLLNEAPTATISGSTTGLERPTGVALDSGNNIYVTDEEAVSVFIYAAGTNGNMAPTATITGGSTELEGPQGVALDSSEKIYVTDNSAIYVYQAIGSNTGPQGGAPIASIKGGSTNLEEPEGIALDSSSNIYVADENGDVAIFPPVGTGAWVAGPPATYSVAPTLTIIGSETGLESPTGVALNSSNKIYVADNVAYSLFVYPALGSSTGTLNEAPGSDTISTATTTGLSQPEGVALDSVGNIYVVDSFLASVFVYPAGNGNAAPTAIIGGNLTGMEDPVAIALDSSGNIYVVDPIAIGVFVFPPLGSNTGPLNEKPTATINGGSTLLEYPYSIALDSSRNIYVVDLEKASVFV